MSDERLETVEGILALPVSSTQPYHEELLSRAISADIPKLRVRAALRLAKIFALPERGAARAEVLDFEVMLWPLRDAFLRDPMVAFELAEVCRASLNLEKIANFICSKLSEATASSDFPQPMWFVLVDLAKWHASRGEEAEARRLWQLARSAPKRTLLDHRVLPHSYNWRFDDEPGAPEDKLCYIHRASPQIMRPLLGPERHCPCCLRPADCKVIQASPDVRNDPRALIPGPIEAQDEKDTFDQQVRKVLAQTFNLDGCFTNLENEGDDSETWQNDATKEAREIVWGRRFKVRIVDDPARTDGVAAAAQHRQNRAEESRLKVRGLATGSEFSSTQSSGRSQTTEHEQEESSDDNSDLYFQQDSGSEPFEGSPS
mmetsp:Transcript_69276/g.84941  ORF Transcript_69276/g.84941 Transcript_69276/m.84941 type:complete len:373 (+) Transcript_69276:63-1181(+)